ncbi:hypothetical protein KCU93_g390, partial [Aureobasidium melanogenum]
MGKANIKLCALLDMVGMAKVRVKNQISRSNLDRLTEPFALLPKNPAQARCIMKTGMFLLCTFVAITAVVLRTIDLSDYLVATGILAATPRIQACESTSHTSAPVAAMARNKADAALVMAAVVHTMASQGSRDSTTGSAADISFRYTSTSENCHTAAKLEDIRTALRKALNLPGKGYVYSTMCLRLTDGGPCKGFLAYGRSDVFDNTTTCDDTLTFSECVDSEQVYSRGISDTSSIAVSSGSVQQIAYAYYAAGENCATMSEVGSIEVALHQKLSKLDARSIEEPRSKHCGRDLVDERQEPASRISQENRTYMRFDGSLCIHPSIWHQRIDDHSFSPSLDLDVTLQMSWPPFFCHVQAFHSE